MDKPENYFERKEWVEEERGFIPKVHWPSEDSLES